jgi:hypothetical protein
MLESWNNGLKTDNLRIWIKWFGVDFHCLLMIVLSHEPYYFSTRWSTNGPNIPSFHCSIIPVHTTATLPNEQPFFKLYFSWKSDCLITPPWKIAHLGLQIVLWKRK